MRILICTGIYPPDIGGPATYANSLSKEIQKLGHQVKIISYGEKRFGRIRNDDLTLISRRHNFLLRYINFFRKALKLTDWADVIYILDLVSAGLPGILAAKLKNKKIVFRTGGDFLWEKACQKGWTELPLIEYYKSKKRFLEKTLLILCRWILNKIDKIIFSTEFQSSIYVQYYNLSEEKIRLVANALPQVIFPEKDEDYKNCIIFAGRLIKLKNLPRLINAFSKTKNKEAKLLIFGQGPEENNLRLKIKNLKLEGKVMLCGNIDRDKLMKAIAGCKFVILPSLSEISPNLAMECLSMSKPIILTRYTGLETNIIKEMITVNPFSENDIREKIEYLLEENNLANYSNNLKRLNIRGKEWRETAEEHISIFESLLK